MMRKRMNRRVDRKVFYNTANRTAKMNIVGYAMRGGIRL